MNIINKNIVINVIGFYICWWLTVLGAISGFYFIGPLVTFFFVVLHLYKVANHKKEDMFLIICFFLGLIIESVLLNSNVIIHKGFLVDYNIAPLWSVSLWVCFGSTLFHSFKWLSKQYFISILLGLFSAPLIYFSMNSIGIIEFGMNKIYVGLITSFLWGIFIPLFIYISDRLLEE